MKKIILVAALFTFLPALAFSADYGGVGTVTLGATGTDRALDVEMSNNVTLQYNADTDGNTFSVGTSHSKGTYTYMSSSEDSVIYRDKALNTAIPSEPTVGTSLGADSTWSIM